MRAHGPSCSAVIIRPSRASPDAFKTSVTGGFLADRFRTDFDRRAMRQSPAMRIRNVIFDFGGVLIRWRPWEIVDGFYTDKTLHDSLRRSVFEHPDWVELDRGTLSEEDAAHRFAARVGRPTHEMRTLLKHVKDSLTPVEECFVIAHDLERRSIALYGLSNMSAATFAHLRERYDHWRMFRGIVISAEVRLVKPDPAIFEHITRRYELDPSETVFIDDHAPNVDAARQLGFRTVLFTDARQCADELNDLLD